MVREMVLMAWLAGLAMGGCESGLGGAAMLHGGERMGSKTQPPPPALVDIGDKLIKPGQAVEVESATDNGQKENDVILLREEVADPSGARPRNAFAAGLFWEENPTATEASNRFRPLAAPQPTIGPAQQRPKVWWEYWRSRWPMLRGSRVTAGSGAFTMPGPGGATVLLAHTMATDPANDVTRVYLIRSGGVHTNGTLSVHAAPKPGVQPTKVDLPPAGATGDWYVDMLADGTIGTAQQVAVDSPEALLITSALTYAGQNGMHLSFP
ncbi:MAG: hypothetical protein JNM80_13870 [Phycisphaerae bacterium]|nr:hypothetical protein [Phycisphaerae bacterium]